MPGSLRLTGGGWRGRKLPPPLAPQTRPSTGRVREALFNSLGALDGMRCLDLFAGSGALGLEAASRGAAEVWLVEKHRAAAQQIRQTVANFGGETNNNENKNAAVTVVTMCAKRFLSRAPKGGVFDLIFIDPPYSFFKRVDDLRGLLSDARNHLAEGGALYLENEKRLTPFAPWQERTARKAGGVHWHLWEMAK